MISPVLSLLDSIYIYNRRKIHSKKALLHELKMNFCQAQLSLGDVRCYREDWYQQQRKGLLSKPLPEGFISVPIRPTSPSLYSYQLPSLGYAAAKGIELLNEDRAVMGEICIPFHKKTARIVYAIILDGCMGTDCAQFLEDHIPSYLKNRLKNLPTLEGDFLDLTIVNTLKSLGPHLNQAYTRYRLRREIFSFATSTALICLLYRRTLYTANIGDSRALFVSAKNVVVLSEDANPRFPKYQDGVKKRGGHVLWQEKTNMWVVQHPRSQATPTVARAIGYPEAHSGVNPRATITKFCLREKGLLVLASKGIWYALSCTEVASWIRHSLEELPSKSSQSIAASIVRLASQRNSIYNLSVLAIEFNNLSSHC